MTSKPTSAFRELARRRRLIALGAALTASAAVMGVTGSPASTAATTSAGNCVTIAGVESSGSKISLETANQASSQSSMYVDATHDRLLTKNNNFQVSPQLATRYTSNKTGTVWTFYLRRGVHFQNGKLFTGADVVYTFKRLLDPASNSEALSSFSAFLSPTGIKAIKPYEVQFTTKHPVGQFPALITTKDTWIVENGATNAQIATQGMGTGPFIPVNFQPGAATYEFTRNPNYWQAGLPKAPCLRFSVVQEAASANAAIETGQVDLLQSADLSTVNTLKSNAGIKLLATPPATSITLSMQVDKPPFDNNLVRQALKDVANRQQMVAVALHGYGAVADDDPVPPTSPQAWRHTVPGQNIAVAKQLLQKAGYTPSHPLNVTLYSADYITGALSVAELYKQQAAQAGINVNLITTPGATYFTNVWPAQAFRGSAWSLRPAEVSLPLEFEGAAPLSGDNETNWHNAQFDALVAKGAAAPNVAVSNGYYKQAEKMLSLKGGAIIPVFFDTVAAIRSTCSGYTPSDDFGQYDFTKLACR